MKISEVSISNCFSFDKAGLNESNALTLGNFNLFVGKNNSGKSNVLKVLQLLESILAPISSEIRLEKLLILQEGVPSSLDGLFFAQDKERVIYFSYTVMIETADKELVRIIESHNNSDNLSNPVLMLLKLKDGYPKIVKIDGAIELRAAKAYARIDSVWIPNKHSTYTKYPLFSRPNSMAFALEDDKAIGRVWRIAKHLNHQDWQKAYSNIQTPIAQFLKNIYDHAVKDLFINIPANRSIEPMGDNIIETLVKMMHGTPESIELYENIIEGIKKIIFETEGINLRYVYPEEGGKHGIKLQLDRVQLPLSSYGSGVEQILALASAIMKNGSNKIVSIEEPEAHFHPLLQRRFIKFLKDIDQAFGHQYCIATHSSTFINAFERIDGSIFFVHMAKNEEECESTRVVPFSIENERTLLLDLGVRPADLRFANGILVVEGPTDKAVFTDWARRIDKPFEDAGLLVIDAEGAGNIPKYLSSEVIQKTCFNLFALCDKNAENDLRKKLRGIVPDDKIVVLDRGDLEDYYPREIVIDFAEDLAEKRDLDAPTEIAVGKTVQVLTDLKGNEMWKKPLAKKIIENMTEEQIDVEIKEKITQIYSSLS